MPGSTSADSTKAWRTRSSSKGGWEELSSIRLTEPGRGASMWVISSPASAETIASGSGLSMTCTSPDCRAAQRVAGRSEEHTSELQSRGHIVCRLMLEKKKKDNEKN